MNYKSILFLLIGCVLFIKCGDEPKDEKQTAVDLMTAQTLGLAYLEEFKLEEAEKEFLKYIDLAPEEKFGYANLGLVYLRMAKYPEAKEQLAQAIKIDAKDPEIRHLLATVYQVNGEKDKAIDELKKALEFAPDHIKILYDLSELYSTDASEDSKLQRKNYILKLIEKAPGNLVPRLNITAIYIQDGEFDKALEQLEAINKQFPDFPKEAVEYYDKTLSLLRKKDQENAKVQFTIFHNYLKVSSPYQAGIVDLKGPGGGLIGFPVITYNRQPVSETDDSASVLDVIKFTNVSSLVGLDIVPIFDESQGIETNVSSQVVSVDYDGDGDFDLYVGSYDPTFSSYNHYLFNNNMGRFTDVSKKAGINHTGKETSVAFADYDNDGFLDLYVSTEKGGILYKNAGKNTFEDVTSKSKINSKTGSNKALFFDLDHDGDLDLFEAKNGANLLHRNNGDGTFTEQAKKMGLAGNDTVNSCNAAFGDFNDDGVIDLFVANKNGSNNLYSNQRQGLFKEITENSGLKSNGQSIATAVGDFNNDGFLDLLVSKGEDVELFENQENGRFTPLKNSKTIFAALAQVQVNDATFFDFDNDGMLDLLIAGEPKEKEGRGVFLYHNEGNGKFKNLSDLLPEETKTGKQIALLDYNYDGDIDIVITGVNGGVSLLRNDGGNMNHYVKMKLVGLKAGSAKNNHFGIGAKVEMRAGDLYQTLVVTDPNVHFGLGKRERADIVRITWTNGVPQNIFMPGANQDLIEKQTLKGSCPFLYTWNGEKYVFVKDITWRSALGMPLGIMGGTMKHAFANASDDYIKISGEKLKPKNGEYSIQITSELWETIYMDKVELVAVDHPDSVAIFVQEQFTPPPFPGMDIYQVNKKHYPRSAYNEKGNDVLKYINSKDDNYLAGFKSGKYQGITEMHDLILDPGDVLQSKKMLLYLSGWIFPTDASINYALSQSGKLKVTPPQIQVMNKKGEWKTVIDNISFPMGKDKTVIVDLSNKFLSKDRRIRIRTNMEIYWDEIFFAGAKKNAPIITTTLDPSMADFHYRGFSREYRKGGRYGPHWFDYYDVNKEPKWQDLTGNYTRYGNVLPLLLGADNKYIISNAGDEMSIKFDANSLPKLKKGWKRDFLIRSVGWVKDGDINTALGNTVLPLPFHGMSSYPPSASEVYPTDPEYQQYMEEYNTRIVTRNAYRDVLKNRQIQP